MFYTLSTAFTHSTGSTIWMKRWRERKKHIHIRLTTNEWNWARFFFFLLARKLLCTEEQYQQQKKKTTHSTPMLISHECTIYCASTLFFKPAANKIEFCNLTLKRYKKKKWSRIRAWIKKKTQSKFNSCYPFYTFSKFQLKLNRMKLCKKS